jgi:tetratricopeptide (TPR) repeat protein
VTSGTEETIAGAPATVAVADVAPSERGDTVGRYVILDALGAGGFGVVYAAYDPELDRKVAVKLLHAPRPGRARANVMHALFGDEPPDTLAPDQGRLIREAQAAARVNHPNVVTVHDVGQHDGRVFIAMEHVDGTTLRGWLSAKPRTWTEVVDIMRQAGAGLAAAHARGLVHRDFKPDNVMIDADGRARVMDFGLVRSDADTTESTGPQKPKIDALGVALTRDGAMMGTPAYMSPEQYLGARVEQASDQFSFCVVLWEALYGERPFRGSSVEELALAITMGDRRTAPSEIVVPAHVRQVLERGLKLQPEDRYPSMVTLLVELGRNPGRRKKWLFGLGGAVVTVGALAGVQEIDRRQEAAACRADAAAIGDVWGEESRATMETAMDATGLPYSATAFEKVRPWLDRYADDWAAAREEACALRDTERLECLDDARAELAGAVRLLSTPDGDVMRNAVMYASQRTPISACSDPAQLRLRKPLPTDPEQREAVRSVRRRLREAQNYQQAGRTDEARALLEGLGEEATALDQPVLAGQIEYVIGAVHEKAGEYDAAETALGEAALMLVRAGADAQASDAAIRLALVVANRQSRPQEGAVWGRWAEALLERAGERGNLREADLHNELALIADERGDYVEALRRYEKHLEIREAMLGPDHPGIGIALNNLGSMHSKLGHNEEAIRRFERALAVSEAALGGDHPDTALPLNNIAKIHWRRGKMDEAREAMERSLKIQEAALGEDHPQVGVSVGNLGIVMRDAGDLDAALTAHQRALEVLRRKLPAKHPAIAAAVKNLGDTQRHRGELAEARRHHEEALLLFEEALGPDHVQVAEALSSTALDLYTAGEYAKATEVLLRARSILEKALGDDNADVGLIFLELGRVALADGRPGDATPSLRRAVELLTENQKLAEEATTLLRRAEGS